MKKNKLYYFEDILNIIFFYSVFITLFVYSIISLVGVCNKTTTWQLLTIQLLSLFVLTVPYLIKKMYHVRISRILTFVFYLIIFMSTFLGRTLNFYSLFKHYDTFLHFVCGTYCGVISISLFLLTTKGNYQNKKLMYSFMITFTMFIGSIWEILRYLINIIFNSAPIDGVGLLNTITDLSADLAGAIFSVVLIAIICHHISKAPASLQITKLKPSEDEVEEIEE